MSELTPIYDEQITNILQKLDDMIWWRIEACKIKYSYYATESYFLDRVKEEDQLLGEMFKEKARIVGLAIPVDYSYVV